MELANLIFEVFIRLIALSWLYIFWRAHQNKGLPTKVRGSKTTAIVYTGWRLYFLFAVILIFGVIPVFVFGTDFLSFFMPNIPNPLASFTFIIAVVVMPIAMVIATIAQVIVDRNEKPKRKAK